MNSPLVSVIIPTYNVAPYIAECLQSVADQTYPNIELIVVDNNSTDDTVERLRELGDAHRFVLTREKTQGGGAARNKGLSLATGAWIQFLDADDLSMPDKIAHQMQLTDHADLIVGNCVKRLINGSEKTVTAQQGCEAQKRQKGRPDHVPPTSPYMLYSCYKSWQSADELPRFPWPCTGLRLTVCAVAHFH